MAEWLVSMCGAFLLARLPLTSVVDAENTLASVNGWERVQNCVHVNCPFEMYNGCLFIKLLELQFAI